MLRINIAGSGGSFDVATGGVYAGAYDLVEASGLYPPPANVVTIENLYAPGSIAQSVHVQERQIVITFAVDDRIPILSATHPGDAVDLSIYGADTGDELQISGLVEGIEFLFFEMRESCTITVKCPDPRFLVVGGEQTAKFTLWGDSAGNVALYSRTLTNDGEYAPMMVELNFTNEQQTITLDDMYLLNTDTQEEIHIAGGVQYSFSPGDVFVIDSANVDITINGESIIGDMLNLQSFPSVKKGQSVQMWIKGTGLLGRAIDLPTSKAYLPLYTYSI